MAKKLMKGCEAVAEAAIQAGCHYFFGYPITPQNDIPEYMARRLPQVGGCFLQAESEVAAINMVYGAAAAGARCMTSSSSPGISLKQEGMTYLAGAELPCVVVNMVRGGPGLGSIQPSQGDYFQATRGGGHGDYHPIVLAPASVQETVDLMQDAFDLADIYRTPVMILADGIIGQIMEPVEFHEKKETRELPAKDWAATGWSPASNRPRAIVNSLYIEVEELQELNDRLQARYQHIRENESALSFTTPKVRKLSFAHTAPLPAFAKPQSVFAQSRALKSVCSARSPHGPSPRSSLRKQWLRTA